MKKIAAAVLGAILAISLSGTAQAGTKGGTTTCTNGSVNSVFGKQQRLSILTLKISGVTFFRENAYQGVAHAPNGGTKSWSADGDWLIWDATYGFCTPQYW
ncbi:hypothetical protein [Buchananella felis]|uniref:hypothetical protein n=1 Tax=Buchananella felis TaxID=3231492 RepID=UPI0035279923